MEHEIPLAIVMHMYERSRVFIGDCDFNGVDLFVEDVQGQDCDDYFKEVLAATQEATNHLAPWHEAPFFLRAHALLNSLAELHGFPHVSTLQAQLRALRATLA